jgi:hypothetical protein
MATLTPIPSARTTNRGCGKTWSPSQLTQCEPQVGKDTFNRRPLPNLPAALFDPRNISKFATSGLFGLFPRHAAVHQIGDLFVKVLAD